MNVNIYILSKTDRPTDPNNVNCMLFTTKNDNTSQIAAKNITFLT